MNEERIAAPVSVQAEQPEVSGNQAASDAAGPSAYENQTLRAVELLRNIAHRPRHRGTVFLDVEDMLEIDAAIAAQEKPHA